MLLKQNKLDYSNIKVYCVMSILNNLGKVCEKVVLHMLAEGCDVHHVLHIGQIGSRKQRNTIDEVARVVSK